MGYIEFQIPKKSGGVRKIEAPDEELKKWLREVLSKIDTSEYVSKFAHGFEKGKNTFTNAKVHLGKKYIVNIDIKDFFNSIKYENFKLLHDEEFQKRLLSDSSSSYSYYDFFSGSNSHLPQGSPLSPFLSNLYLKNFDIAIFKLARKYISDDICYTRYADDMTFSSNSMVVRKIVYLVEKLLSRYKLRINRDKVRFMTRGTRQNVTGYNLNSGRVTVPKEYRKKIRAIVHRLKQGYIMTEEQRDKLLGMIAYIETCHKEEAQKYRDIVLKARVYNKTCIRKFNKNYIQLETKSRKKKAEENKTVLTIEKEKDNNTTIKNPIRKIKRI